MQIKNYYIDDQDERADKIKQGYGYSFVKGELVVGDQKTNPDLESLQTKLSEGTASNRDMQEVLNYLLKKQLESGKI